LYLECVRLEEIYKQAMREFHNSARMLTTVRERVKILPGREGEDEDEDTF
jgi:hypothetical protein